MAIWTTASASSNVALGHVPKSRVTSITLNANGLMPMSAYTFWCNGVNMTWACRIPGRKQGTGLVSDKTGSMTVLFSVELTEDNGTNGSTKYNSMQLKNINGEVHSFSISPQNLIGK